MSDIKRHDAIQGRIVHVYDGIEEADNKLPGWWLATLYITIVFSFIYWGYFHTLKAGKLPYAEFEEALAKSAGSKVSEEQLAALVKDDRMVGEGKALFATHCMVCHEADGRGKIGPNLTDDHWIHGGAALDIHTVMNNGILTKGMPAWGQVLGPVALQKLTAFVLSIRGTNIPGKAAEGAPWPTKATDSK